MPLKKICEFYKLEVCLTFSYLISGEIGLVNNSDWCEPKDPSDPSHVEAAERAMLCKLGWFSEPVYGTGDYPEVFKQQIQEATEKAGLPPLPKFTEEEIKLNKGIT